jgi:hypothetical protein
LRGNSHALCFSHMLMQARGDQVSEWGLCACVCVCVYVCVWGGGASCLCSAVKRRRFISTRQGNQIRQVLFKLLPSSVKKDFSALLKQPSVRWEVDPPKLVLTHAPRQLCVQRLELVIPWRARHTVSQSVVYLVVSYIGGPHVVTRSKCKRIRRAVGFYKHNDRAAYEQYSTCNTA